MSEPDPWDDDTATAPTEAAGPQLYYGSVDEFVRDYLIHTYRRRINGTHPVWAAEWWRYEEAIGRLEALWRAWEHLRLDPATGMSVWWRDHADPHMAALMSPDGPFAGEDTRTAKNTNRPGQPLPYAAPPAGLFLDVRRASSPSTGSTGATIESPSVLLQNLTRAGAPPARARHLGHRLVSGHYRSMTDPTTASYEFDVAVSFAGEDREYVEDVVEALKTEHRVFYDKDYEVEAWGEDGVEYFTNVYMNRARYVLIFVSQNYAAKMWTRLERRSALAKAATQKSAYVLPIRLESVDLEGLLPTVTILTRADSASKEWPLPLRESSLRSQHQQSISLFSTGRYREQASRSRPS